MERDQAGCGRRWVIEVAEEAGTMEDEGEISAGEVAATRAATVEDVEALHLPLGSG